MTIKTRVLKRYNEYVVQWTDGEISWMDTYAFAFLGGEEEAKELAITAAKVLLAEKQEQPAAIVWESDK